MIFHACTETPRSLMSPIFESYCVPDVTRQVLWRSLHELSSQGHMRCCGITCGYAESETRRADARGRKRQERGGLVKGQRVPSSRARGSARRGSQETAPPHQAALPWWGGCSKPLPHQLGGLAERYKLPEWGTGRSPGKLRISYILILENRIKTDRV